MYLDCWLRCIFKIRLRHCIEGKTAITDPIQSKYAFWNNVYVNWDHLGWTIFHPLWKNRCSYWWQWKIPSGMLSWKEQNLFCDITNWNLLTLDWSNIISTELAERRKIPGVVHRQEGTMSPEIFWQLYCKSGLDQTSPWPGDANYVAHCSYIWRFRSLSTALLSAHMKSTIWTAQMLFVGNPYTKGYVEVFWVWYLRQMTLERSSKYYSAKWTVQIQANHVTY